MVLKLPLQSAHPENKHDKIKKNQLHRLIMRVGMKNDKMWSSEIHFAKPGPNIWERPRDLRIIALLFKYKLWFFC